ncbi:MAG: PstS family phosphate ABC transporter substrate-binding protein [Kosmotoga sp.]|jgi:phosphate transport system substrate-binding protein|nr:MAG: PstS family phosphate ABC transporter substrate-binding protein [Kosmotoga sp.]
MKRVIVLVLMFLLALTAFSQSLVIKGSNTVYPVAQVWAEEFKKEHPDVNITLEGAGSSTGIKALFNNQTDIANASRWLKDSELKLMNEEGRYFVPFIVGYDGIAVIVNPSLPLDSITTDQLKKLYTGEITNWSQIDPELPNTRVVLYSRDTASGTFEYFVESVLEGERLVPYTQMLPSNRAEVEQVSQNKYAIGYVGMAYVTDEVKALKVNSVEPSLRNVNSGEYPISRPLFMFLEATNGLPKGLAWEFLQFGLSPKGQSLILDVGYVNAYGTDK